VTNYYYEWPGEGEEKERSNNNRVITNKKEKAYL
jgi:hypothetical protein